MHSESSYMIGIEEAKKSSSQAIYLDQGIRKASGVKLPRNTRPDASTLRKDGKVSTYEVKSKTDDINILKKKVQDTTKELKAYDKADGGRAYEIRDIIKLKEHIK